MTLGIFIGFAVLAAVSRTSVFRELLTGGAFFGVVIGVVTLDLGTALFSLLLLIGCCWHLARVA